MKIALSLLLILGLAACNKPAPPAAAEEEPHPESVTHWTPATELFAEYPPLIAGETSRFAIHFTRLDNFKPVTDGRVEVKLTAADGRAESFTADAPSRPGIFGVDVKPAAAGPVRLSILLSGSLNATHDLGEITIYPTRAAAIHTHDHEDDDGILFTKEQQWTLDFATAVVETRPLRSSLRVPAEVLPRSGGEAEVTVPFDGRLIADRLPIIGARVAQGQVLAQLLPPTSAPSDLSSLELVRNEAQLALELASRDRERAARLVESGAAPARRLDEARTLEATLEARLHAAQARLAQFETSSSAEPDARGARLFALRAPISGIVTETTAAPNANVKAGETLFRILDADTVYISALVPESALELVQHLSGAQLELPASDQLLPLSHLISIGRVIDPQTRTFPVIYQLDNRARRVAINQTLHARLLTRPAAPAPVVPESALVDDSGRPVVYVQTAGEAFLRRPVRLGIRETGAVQILEGVAPGERVVTRGAHLLRLASLSTQAPAEGHVH